MGLARPNEWETWPYHCSLCLFTMVRRCSCGPIACWILAWTSSLVTWSLYKMGNILQERLISMACILHRSSAVRVHDSQAYRKMDVTRECISCILELTEIYTPVIPNRFQPCQCCYCLCYPGKYLGTLISYNWAPVLEACHSLKLLSIYFHLCVDATGVVCHQLGLLGTNLQAVGCGGLEDHEGIVSTEGRPITNLSFAADVDG